MRMRSLTHALLVVLLALLLAPTPLLAKPTFRVSGGGTDVLRTWINNNQNTGGTLIIEDSGTYTETSTLWVGPRYSATYGRRSFDIEAKAGCTPTIVLNGAQAAFVMYSAASDLHVGSVRGGRITINANNGGISGTNGAAFWYIGQENGCPAGYACQATLENLKIDTDNFECIDFGAGAYNDATPNTYGASVTMRYVQLTGGQIPIRLLYGPASYASSFRLINCVLLDFNSAAVNGGIGIELGTYNQGGDYSVLDIKNTVCYKSCQAGSVESNTIVGRLGQIWIDHSDLFNDQSGSLAADRTICLVGSGTCKVTNSHVRGVNAAINLGSWSASCTDGNVTATGLRSSGFTLTNCLNEWPVYTAYGNDPTVANYFKVASGKTSLTHGGSPPLGAVGPDTAVIPTPTPTPTPASNPTANGYISYKHDAAAETITSLRFDATGQGNYGLECVPAGYGIRGVYAASASGATLTLTPVSNGVLWDIPYDRDGYYDVNTSLNYPNDMDTKCYRPLVLPFCSFTGSSGQVTRLEHFKRLPESISTPYFLWLNLAQGNRLLMRTAPTENYDLETYWPGCTSIYYYLIGDRLVFEGQTGANNVTITAIARDSRDVPQDTFGLPAASFTPDPLLTYEPTGKSIPLSQALTDFMRQGIYWYPYVLGNGEWLMGAVQTHMISDPRSYYPAEVRLSLLRQLGLIGYDRFGHFGYVFPWGQYPDYAAGAMLNVPPGAASYDMRTPACNGMLIQAVMDYVLSSGDTALLDAKRARAVVVDGVWICGGNYDVYDNVLNAGDVPYDGRTITPRHSLGQSFTVNGYFSQVSALAGNPHTSQANSFRLALYRNGKSGPLVSYADFSFAANTVNWATLTLGSQEAPGVYYLEMTNLDNGSNYWAPSVFWVTQMDSGYTGGDAYIGDLHGSVRNQLESLFSYLRNYMGASSGNIAYFQNNSAYNITTPSGSAHKAARTGTCTTSTYWEGPGGGYDTYTALWYNAACLGMAEMYDLLGETANETTHRTYYSNANVAFGQKFWGTMNDNGALYERFIAAQDWDGVRRDYGYTYYTLEAAVRGVVNYGGTYYNRNFIWWLDRGQYKMNGTWKDDIYSLWEVAPPFNTIDNTVWTNVTGTCPYMEVLCNGGTRLDVAARDLTLRARNLTIDNMHERNLRVLSRYVSPDRLTGGRTYNDPGGRGRWQFLGPNKNIQDFEGFREIFPQGGTVASMEPAYYLGFNYTGDGLKLNPLAPSGTTRLAFENIAYWKSVFKFMIEPSRTTVASNTNASSQVAVPAGDSLCQTFTPASPFNKVGVQLRIYPFRTRTNNKVTLTLQKLVSGAWADVDKNWQSHVQDGQWVYVTSRSIHAAGAAYRLVINGCSPASGETIKIAYNTSDVYGGGTAYLLSAPGTSLGDLAFMVQSEENKLTIESQYNPSAVNYTMSGTAYTPVVTDLGNGLKRWETYVEADETASFKAN